MAQSQGNALCGLQMAGDGGKWSDVLTVEDPKFGLRFSVGQRDHLKVPKK